MTHLILEVDGLDHHELLHYMNGFEPERFPPLTSAHLAHGLWWLAVDDNVAIGFAALVPFFGPNDGVGYLKRAYVLPQYRGQGMQASFVRLREERARSLGWHLLVTECAGDNLASAKNLLRAGYEKFTPDQLWGEQDSVYFRKRL